MFVPFQSIPNTSRVWVFQADRKLNSQESKIISDTLMAFTERWLVHGSPMAASFDIRFDQFIILAADEDANAASGCSIDDSVRTIKNLGTQLGLDFFDRTRVAFKTGEEVFTIPMSALKEKLAEGLWNSSSLVFNNLVNAKGDLSTTWLSEASSTWLKRYFPKQEIIG
jgi:hypothetical protein